MRKKDKSQTLLSEEKIAGDTEEPDSFSDNHLRLLYEAIKKLSEVDRAIILLYLEENSYQEISEIIGTNPNNIGVRITRIKKRLKKILDGKFD